MRILPKKQHEFIPDIAIAGLFGTLIGQFINWMVADAASAPVEVVVKYWRVMMGEVSDEETKLDDIIARVEARRAQEAEQELAAYEVVEAVGVDGAMIDGN